MELTDRHQTEALEQRAAVHRALGEPLRLAIIEALALSDLTPSELEARFEVPSNLLAHHLQILEASAVISRHRSEGDARRRYLTLDRAALAEAGVDLHPRAASPARPDRVVFVCTRNSARSPLAAALWARRSSIPATSAGTHPAAAVHPLAVAAGARRNVAIRHLPRLLEPGGPGDDGRDLVVTVCDQAREETALPEALHWSIPDPVRDGRPEAFDRAADALLRRIEELAVLTEASHEDETDRPVSGAAAKGELT